MLAECLIISDDSIGLFLIQAVNSGEFQLILLVLLMFTVHVYLSGNLQLNLKFKCQIDNLKLNVFHLFISEAVICYEFQQQNNRTLFIINVLFINVVMYE